MSVDRTDGVPAANGSRLLHWLVTPYGMVTATVALSALAWLLFDPSLPGGYHLTQPLTMQAALILSAWYLVIVGFAFFGFAIGRRLALPPQVEADIAWTTRLDGNGFYYLYSITGAIGTAVSVYRIVEILGIDGIVASVVNSGANALTGALYQDYRIGLVSLRYICALSGGIALWRLLLQREWRVVHVANILILLVTVATAGRLLFLTALFVSLCLGLTSGRLGRIRPVATGAGLAAAVATLGVYSYIRTGGTYDHAGYGGFWQVLALQMASYLSTPFQASLGIANHLGWISSLYTERELIDLSTSYTTNSAFDYYIVYRGGWAWLEIVPVSAGLAMLMGYCRRFPGSYLACGDAALLYVFAELWRTAYYIAGSFKTELIFGMFLPLTLGIGVNLLRRATVLLP
jgi:hypothetical protein